MDRDEGHVPLAEVRPRGLPEAGAVPDDVQDVVHDLERDPEIQPVVADGLHMLEARAGQEARNLRAGHDRQGGLPPDDVEVLVLAHARVVRMALLTDLALREGRARVRGQLDDLRVELPADPEGLHEQEVPRHEGVLEAELLVRCRTAPAHLPTVVDVVMD